MEKVVASNWKNSLSGGAYIEFVGAHAYLWLIVTGVKRQGLFSCRQNDPTGPNVSYHVGQTGNASWLSR